MSDATKTATGAGAEAAMPEELSVPVSCESVHRHSLPMAALSLCLGPDGQLAYAACMDAIYQVHLETGEFTRLYQHRSYASGVGFVGPDELVSAGYDGMLQWFDLRQGLVVRQRQAHRFWSWDMAISPDKRFIASATGQYLTGSYQYNPQPANEATVLVYAAETGERLQAWELGPPVQAVAISPDSRFVAAGNLMGQVAVWDVNTGQQVANWTTDSFTSWGIIKSHCYIGGVYALAFGDQQHLLVGGMGPMRDPMAGNGRQLWQRFAWQENPARKLDEAHPTQVGEGLMETLAVHPSGKLFVLAGRLRGGSWNVGLFSNASGELLHSFKTDCRVTQAVFSTKGERLVLAATEGQNGDLKRQFGRVLVYDVRGVQG